MTSSYFSNIYLIGNFA
jgi:F0F1-type ATP synthase beta subunit